MSASSIDNATEAEAISYFTTAHRRTVSEPESPSISPHTYPASAPARSTRRLRPSIRPHIRAKSDEVSGYSRFAVQTIDENEASQNNIPLSAELEILPTPKGRSAHTSEVPSDAGSSQVPPSVALSQRSSSKASVRSFIGKFLPRPIANSKRHNLTPVSPAKPGASHQRPCSESDAGRSKAKASITLPSRKTRSVENIGRRRFRSSSESSRPTPPAALRPPVSRNISENSLGGHHEIKIETPFTQLRKDSEVLHGEPPPSRRSSLRPRIVFGAPLSVFRKLRRLSKTTTASSPRPRSASLSTSDIHGGQMVGHASQLRRKHTRDALRQVSQVLRLIAGDKPDVLPVDPKLVRSRTFSDDSTPSAVQQGTQRRPLEQTQGVLLAPSRITTQKSMEIELDHGYSASSSIRNLRLGPPPNATPDERATYKLKRSPSAETEEFLKVDISIRGGTSYLPSEARRIHTPPLPGEGAGGKRRGFFFDYNAPGQLKESFDHMAYPSLRTGMRTSTRPAEWYDTKLAELDTTSDEGTPDAKPVYSFSEMRRRTEQALLEMRTRKAKVVGKEEEAARLSKEDEEDEGEIDYTIPEHYTNSPLCPANPQYWRLVDGKLGKGKYARMCWMHSAE